LYSIVFIVLQISTKSQGQSIPTTKVGDFLTLDFVKEAARMLGISIHTLYSWVSQCKIPFVKCGRRTEFDIKDLDAWIEKNKTSEQEF